MFKCHWNRHRRESTDHNLVMWTASNLKVKLQIHASLPHLDFYSWPAMSHSSEEEKSKLALVLKLADCSACHGTKPNLLFAVCENDKHIHQFDVLIQNIFSSFIIFHSEMALSREHIWSECGAEGYLTIRNLVKKWLFFLLNIFAF